MSQLIHSFQRLKREHGQFPHVARAVRLKDEVSAPGGFEDGHVALRDPEHRDAGFAEELGSR